MSGESKVILWQERVSVWPDEYIAAKQEALGGRVSIQDALCLMAGDGVLDEGVYTVYYPW